MATVSVAKRATPVLRSETATLGVDKRTTLCGQFGDSGFLCVPIPNCVFFLPLPNSAPPLPMFPLEFRDEVNHEETRVVGLLP